MPEWIKGVIPPQKEIWTVAHERSKGGDRSSREFEAQPLSQKVKWVCRDCNTGWMSDLERAAKPMLASMIKGRGRELHKEGQRTVALWAFKTAVMLDLVGIAGGQWPIPHLQWVYEHRDDPGHPLPPGSFVWIAGHGVADMAPIYRHHGLFMRPEEEAPLSLDNEPNAHVATFTVGYLAFQVFGTVDFQRLEIVNSGKVAEATLQLWPRPGGRSAGPPICSLSAGDFMYGPTHWQPKDRFRRVGFERRADLGTKRA